METIIMSKKRKADTTEDLNGAISTMPRTGRNALPNREVSPHSDSNVRILRAVEEDGEGVHDFVV
jgi:hypothetical protein